MSAPESYHTGTVDTLTFCRVCKLYYDPSPTGFFTANCAGCDPDATYNSLTREPHMLATFKPGTILVTEGGPDWIGRLLTWGQGSLWTHAVMVTHDGRYIDAQPFAGVRESALEPYLQELADQKRSWVALDTPELNDFERAVLVNNAQALLGRKYDYLQALAWFLTHGFWSDGELRLICTRLVTAAYHSALPALDLFPDQNLVQLPTKRIEDLRAGYCTPASLLTYSSLSIVGMSVGAYRKL